MSLRIGQEIYAALTADALPGGADQRVFPVLAPAGALALPFVTYQCKALAGSYTKDGDVVDRGTVVVSCVAKTYCEAVELAVAVRGRLTGCPRLAKFLTRSSGRPGWRPYVELWQTNPLK